MIIDIVAPWNMILSLMLAFIPYVVISSFWQHLDMIFRNKLLVTDEGIWLTQTHRYFFSWQSLEELGYHPKSKFAKQVDWGIRAVGANHIHYSPIGRFLLNGRNCDKFIPLYYFVEIPISPFWLWQRPDVEKFRETEFGQILYDHAPHLFEDDDEWKPKNRLRDDYIDDEQPYWDDDGQLSDKQYG
ncbi:MAG: hypothetical protein AAF846_29845 [Chloroflexota bacterium]